MRRRHASHITVVLSKAAHSGPSVYLRARAPCPLGVSCPEADRALCSKPAGESVQCELQVFALPWPLGCETMARVTKREVERDIAMMSRDQSLLTVIMFEVFGSDLRLTEG